MQSYHMYYLLLQNNKDRNDLIYYLKENNISAVFHYLPLHSSRMGMEIGSAVNCPVTTSISERIIRLPLYAGIKKRQIEFVNECIKMFSVKLIYYL